MSSAQVKITQLPTAGPITGTEAVPIVQNGLTVQTTTAAIAATPSQFQTFLTLNSEPTLPNSRYLSTGLGLGLSDGGALSYYRITLNRASGSLENALTGIVAKDSASSVVARTLQTSGNGLSVSNGNGVSGNPVFSLTGQVLSLANASGAGFVALPNNGSVVPRTIQGTASEIDVTNGTGALGDPTIGIADNPVIPGAGGMVLPSGNTAARPGSPSNGLVRYNSQTNRVEAYQGGSWTNFGTGDGTVTSVGLSGGATGLTVSGSPITGSGTFTLGGTPVKASNLDNGTANEIPYQSAPSTTSFITAPVAADTFLKWNGSGFVWGAVAGAGTVTSVDGSGGTTGLTLTGGPITAAGTLTLGGTLNVANGGTGTTSLTGYVFGNGTGAMTASATIPNTDITGLGSISTQSASSVSITGGTIDGTTIGGTVSAAGTFTTVTMTSGTITTAPTSGNDIVNKTYADSIASGINFHQSCVYATTAALAANTYNNGISGVGATLTGNVNGALVIDGHTFVSPTDVGKRVLIKNEGNAAYNGVYTVTQTGSAGAVYILTRATDFDTAGSGVDQIDQGDFFLITSGTANANTSWVQQTPLPVTVGTTGIVFTQFGTPITYSAGTGLTESPAYTFNIANTGVTAGNYGDAATAVTLSINAQGQITSATNASIAISASQVTSGTLAAVRGGTGIGSYSVGDLLFANTTTTLDKLTIGTNGYVLVSNGTAPGYVAQSTLSVGFATSAGSAGSATDATNISITEDTTSSSTVYPVWVTANTGNLPAKVTSTKLTYVPSTGTLSTTTFNGALTGNATSATNATNVATTATGTNADFFIPFVAASTTGNQGLGVDAGFTYNPSTNAVTSGISGGTF